MTQPTLHYKILDPRIGTTFALPAYATPGSAGLDLMACVTEDTTLAPDQTILIPSGIAIHLDNTNLAAMILPRSGLGHRDGIILGNGTGLIDSDYQGELKISCWNRSQTPFVICPGMRIAQLMIVPVVQPLWEQVSEFSATTRGAQGFGSTGQHATLHPKSTTHDT